MKKMLFVMLLSFLVMFSGCDDKDRNKDDRDNNNDEGFFDRFSNSGDVNTENTQPVYDETRADDYSNTDSSNNQNSNANSPYSQWIGVWENSEGNTLVIRQSTKIDFVLDMYYFYIDQGNGFQINVSDYEVDKNNIFSTMVDYAFDYDASYDFELEGDTLHFIYNYQGNVIKNEYLTRTSNTDVDSAWSYYWNY